MRLHPEGPAHMTPWGSVALVVVCAALAVGAVYSLPGTFTLTEPALLLLFVPVLFAVIGARYTFHLFRLWEASRSRRLVTGQRMVDPRLYDAAEEVQDRAASWCAAAMLFSLPAAAGVADLIFN